MLISINRSKVCHRTPQETILLMEESIPTPDKPWNKKYAIMLRPNPSGAAPNKSEKPLMIGVVGTPREAEIAYKLLPDYWGKGYMSEAISLLLELWWSQEGEL
jgi:ribosomal-protein-alanine N-acetyltransferase